MKNTLTPEQKSALAHFLGRPLSDAIVDKSESLSSDFVSNPVPDFVSAFDGFDEDNDPEFLLAYGAESFRMDIESLLATPALMP